MRSGSGLNNRYLSANLAGHLQGHRSKSYGMLEFLALVIFGFLFSLNLAEAADFTGPNTDIAALQLRDSSPEKKPVANADSWYTPWLNTAAATAYKYAGNIGRVTGIDTFQLNGTRDFGLNIDRDVRQILENKALSKYFPDKEEINRLAEKYDSRARFEVLNTYLINDQQAVKANDLVVSEVSNLIVNRILDKEGIKDESRRAAWQAKILAPFKSCIATAKTYQAAEECRQIYKADAAANIALTATYELAREEFRKSPLDKTGDKSAKEASVHAKEAFEKAKSKLDWCWRSGAEIEKNSDCLNDGVTTGIRSIATKKVDALIPDSIKAHDPRLQPLLVEEFVKCAGESLSGKTTATIDTCKRDVTRVGGAMISESVIPAEIEKFVAKRGGLEALRMNKEDQQKLATGVLDKQKTCLAQDVPADKAEENLDVCMRKSIQDIALPLGERVLNQRVRKHLEEDASETVRTAFRKDLTTCTDAVTLSNYDKELDRCELELSRIYTARIARESVGGIVEAGLADDPKARKAVSEKLEKKIKEIEKAKDGDEIDRKAHELKAEGTFEVTKRAMHKEAKEKLGSAKLPKELSDLDELLKKCLEGAKPGAYECAAAYVRDFTKELGTQSIQKQLAARGVSTDGKLRTQLAGHFHTCVDEIKLPVIKAAEFKKIAADFKKSAELCATDVEKKAVSMVAKSTLIPAATAHTKNAAVRAKTEKVIGEAVDCLSEMDGLKNGSTQSNVQGLLKAVESYYAYNPQAANQSLEAAIGDVKKDLAQYGAAGAQDRLIDNMSKHGVLDQLMKAAIRDEVRSGLKGARKDDLPSDKVLNQILTTQNFDKIFTPAVLAKLRATFAQHMMKPMLLEGKSLDSPDVRKAKIALRSEVSLILAQSPHFGTMIANSSVQKSMNKMDGTTRFFAQMMYGDRATNWDAVPESQAKEQARQYIQQKLLYPKIVGLRVSPSEEARHHEKAKELVMSAVTGSSQSVSSTSKSDVGSRAFRDRVFNGN